MDMKRSAHTHTHARTDLPSDALLPTSGEKGSYWFSFSGSLTAWLYTCCRMWRRRPLDGCLFSLWAGSDVPFSLKKAGNTNFETQDTRCNATAQYRQVVCCLFHSTSHATERQNNVTTSHCIAKIGRRSVNNELVGMWKER
jgi:hypothetical protein